MADALPDCGQGIAGTHRPSRNRDCPTRQPPHAGDDFGQLALAVAGDPGNADDLTRVDGQVDLLQGERAEIAQGGYPTEIEDHVSLRLGDSLLFLREDNVTPNHHPGQLSRIGLLGQNRPDQLSLTEDGHAGGDRHHLFELVRDKDHGPAFGDHQTEGLEEVLGLLRREQGGRFIEDQDAGAAVQRFKDLDSLLFANRQLPHAGAGIDGHPVAPCQLGNPALDHPWFEQEAAVGGVAVAKHEVLRHRERRRQSEMLMHHADAGLDGIARGVKGDRVTPDEDLALVGPI